MRRALALAVACSSPPAPLPVGNHIGATAVDVEIAYSVTSCFGSCPVYRFTLYGDGRVRWHGESGVARLGDVAGQVHPIDAPRLDAAIAHARFFERDHDGNLPCKTLDRCVIVGCSDTSHVVVTIKRGPKVNSVDDARCGAYPELTALETLIEDLAEDKQWVGAPRY